MAKLRGPTIFSVAPTIVTLVTIFVSSTGSMEPAHAAPLFKYPFPDYSVIPILFSPTDWNVQSAEVQSEAAALATAMLEIQEFYRTSLGGRTFRLNPLQVIQALGPKEDYGIHWNGNNIYEDGVEFTGNMEHEVVSELHGRGYPTPPGQNESGYSVLIFVKGAGGWAGARELGAADGGWGILGDWCIDSIQGTVPEGAYWWSGRRLQVGAAAHELGHTFGLPHPDAYNGEWSTTVMGHWWNYPNLGLNEWEIDSLDANKAAFFVMPGDYNQNGKVDAADYVLWRKSPNAYGGNPAGYDTWRANFGQPPGSGSGTAVSASAAVPEPTANVLLISTTVSFLFLRRTGRIVSVKTH